MRGVRTGDCECEGVFQCVSVSLSALHDQVDSDSDSDSLFTKFYNKENVSKAVSVQP